MSPGNTDRDQDSETERHTSLQSSRSGSGHLDLGGWGGARGIRAKGWQGSRKNIGRGASEQSLHCDLQNDVSSIFFSHLTLVLPGAGGR